MGLFDFLKKKPTQAEEPIITPSSEKKKIQPSPTKSYKIDYNSHWAKETLKTIPTYTGNYRIGFRGIPASLISDEQFKEFWIDYCEIYNLFDENPDTSVFLIYRL